MKTPYEPKGRVCVLLKALRKRPPGTILIAREMAAVMSMEVKGVWATVFNAEKAGLLHIGYTEQGTKGLSLEPFPEDRRAPPLKRVAQEPRRPVPEGWATNPDDPRIGKIVPGWKPPQMVCARGA